MPGNIEWVIVATLAPIRAEMREYRVQIEGHKLALDDLALRVEECEKDQAPTDVVTTLKADIVGLHRDVDEMNSTDLSILFGTVEILEVPRTYILACSEVPPTTIGDKTRADDADAESEAKTNE
ncbi:uncharacterized protein LOC125863717 [Solanum stenotomum]|uniref:uncharacterized protein LOC125863717 n=1 Tax=Solanum stenotomum TaxID=172797 RepID=UPI0020D1E7C5|nr:uncharacterized protein LOC125863717 [Solanum stenotomum]